MKVPSLSLLTLTSLPLGHALFNPLHHLGGNSPFFSGPNIFEIDPNPPPNCHVDQVAFLSRHGSRYPDPSAYEQWTNLSAKIRSARFTTHSPDLTFLHTWQPLALSPSTQLSQLSLTGYQELSSMGVTTRWTYPHLYTPSTPFHLWANLYSPTVPRVVDSALLFARTYLGPNSSTLGSIYILDSHDPRSIGNSLAPSDLCPNYIDNSGGAAAQEWDRIYLPPIAARINSLLDGLEFTSADVSLFPYLCGFETQITNRRSAWCDVLTPEEILDYEYAQDLRYWYGSGLGAPVGKGMMLPFLRAVVDILAEEGPSANSSSTPPNPVIATFSNDGQINQLAAALGVFDEQHALSGRFRDPRRVFRASAFVTMRGTLTLERLSCADDSQDRHDSRDTGNLKFVRIKLNDAVYPIAGCADGPGRSCKIEEYRALVRRKQADFGNWEERCGVLNGSQARGEARTTFLEDLRLPFERVVRA